MKRIINGLVIALFTLPAFAQDSDDEPRWYEIEIIVFENQDPASMESEHWPLDIERPDLSDTIELRSYPVSEANPINETTPIDTSDMYLDTPYLRLPPELYQLADAYQKLDIAKNYQPLIHTAWRQIVPPRSRPDRIYIHELRDTDATVETIQNDAPPFIRIEPDLTAEVSAFDPDAPEYTVSGVISLGLGRYLHIDADLLLYKLQPHNPVEVEDTPPLFESLQVAPFVFRTELEPALLMEQKRIPELFRIQGNLRMRSKEVHYLDHPLLGMLILITPYTPPQQDIDAVDVEEPVQLQPLTDENPNQKSVAQPGRIKEDRSF